MSSFRNSAFAAAIALAGLGGTTLSSAFAPALAEMTVEVGGARCIRRRRS